MALLGFSDTNTRLHYQDCGERLDRVYEEVGVNLFHWSRVKPYQQRKPLLTQSGSITKFQT